MNAFTAAAAALLSRYSENLLRDECEAALSGNLAGAVTSSSGLTNTAILLINSFKEEDLKVRGLHRVNGSIVQQTKALQILEHSVSLDLKDLIIRELSAEDKAGCLRVVLRKLPDTLFPLCQRAALLDLAEIFSNRENCKGNVLKALQILIYFIPESLKLCLKHLLIHLCEIIRNAEQNKMGVENVAILFVSIIFPIAQDADTMSEMKMDIVKMSKLIPILLNHSEELFSLPDEVILTLESSLEKQTNEMNCSRCSTPCVNEDPEIVMSATCSEYQTPTKFTTDYELAKLMADISSMPDGPIKKKLLKRTKQSQRQQLGIQRNIPILKSLSKYAEILESKKRIPVHVLPTS